MTFSQILLMLAIQVVILFMLCHGAYEVTTKKAKVCTQLAIVALFAFAVIDMTVIIEWAAHL